MSTITTFIKANAAAYAKAAKVFKAIEGADYLTTLAEAGITGSDVRVYATIYVAEQSGVNPHPSQRGGELVFTKNTPEYNKVKYIMGVINGQAQVRKAKTSHKRIELPKGMSQGIVNQIIAAGLNKDQLNALLSQVRESITFA